MGSEFGAHCLHANIFNWRRGLVCTLGLRFARAERFKQQSSFCSGSEQQAPEQKVLVLMQIPYSCVGRCVTVLTGKLKEASCLTKTVEIP